MRPCFNKKKRISSDHRSVFLVCLSPFEMKFDPEKTTVLHSLATALSFEHREDFSRFLESMNLLEFMDSR